MDETGASVRIDAVFGRRPLAQAVTPVVQQQNVDSQADQLCGVGQAVRCVSGVAVEKEKRTRCAWRGEEERMQRNAVFGSE